MQNFPAVATCACLTVLLACLTACGNSPTAQQAQIAQAFAVACTIDGTVVPLSQPVVATLGAGGATAASLDALLVHPSVVAACKSVNGTPASVVVVAAPSGTSPNDEAKPAN